jgi:hypothetical protein
MIHNPKKERMLRKHSLMSKYEVKEWGTLKNG